MFRPVGKIDYVIGWIDSIGFWIYPSAMMTNNKILRGDEAVVSECLLAAANGPFIPAWEFETLMGVGKDEFSAIAARWPAVDPQNEIVRTAVSNCLLNLSGYPIDDEERWFEYISVPRQALREVLMRFRSAFEVDS